MTRLNQLLFRGVSLTTLLLFTACGGSSSSSNEDSNTPPDTTTPITLPISYKADAGRLLGSQCAQCHGTNGLSKSSWDSIAGEDEFVHEDFGEDPIMKAQADGYTYDEKVTISNWLQTLKKNDNDDD